MWDNFDLKKEILGDLNLYFEQSSCRFEALGLNPRL